MSLYLTVQEEERLLRDRSESAHLSFTSQNKKRKKTKGVAEASSQQMKPNKTKVVEQSESTIKSKRRSLTREGCNAKAVFKLAQEGKYELIQFHETQSPSTKKLLIKKSRLHKIFPVTRGG